jgi:hypothetical protein
MPAGLKLTGLKQTGLPRRQVLELQRMERWQHSILLARLRRPMMEPCGRSLQTQVRSLPRSAWNLHF